MQPFFRALTVVALLGVATPGCSDGGVESIYRQCTAFDPALSETYTSDFALRLQYPSTWTGAQSARNAYTLSAPYDYVPANDTTPRSTRANVSIAWENTARDEADVQRMLDSYASTVGSGWPVRYFSIDGHPAVAYAYEHPPYQLGCENCPVDPGPNFAVIGVATADGLSIIDVNGSARVNAPDAIFCEIQAIEASISF